MEIHSIHLVLGISNSLARSILVTHLVECIAVHPTMKSKLTMPGYISACPLQLSEPRIRTFISAGCSTITACLRNIRWIIIQRKAYLKKP